MPGKDDSEMIRGEIVEIGARLAAGGYIVGAEGNISARLDRDTIIITSAGTDKGKLNPADLLIVSLADGQISPDCKVERQRPSSELAMHLQVYRQRPDIGACVHSHPPYACGFAYAGIQPENGVSPEVIALVGEIRLTEYAQPGTPALGESLRESLDSANAFILANHGLLTIGESLAEAMTRHEVTERYLRALAIAKSLGSVKRLP